MIGEIIAKKRAEMKLSQEQLAEMLCVSRSAIAKWETGKGVPDVENIKALANVFQMTTDELLEIADEKVPEKTEEMVLPNRTVIPEEKTLEPYYFKKCSVELSGWNNGFQGGYIVGEDREYLFYVIPEKKTIEFGAVRKAAIVSVTEEKERKPVEWSAWPKVDRAYFVGKIASVWLSDEKLIDFTFREKEFIDVPILAFSEEKVVVLAGKEFPAEDVVEVKVRCGWGEV